MQVWAPNWAGNLIDEQAETERNGSWRFVASASGESWRAGVADAAARAGRAGPCNMLRE